MAQKEQCFIITPIGDENSEIRRHIEGIIDAVIKPALEEWYEIEVAHRISTPGSITKQIIEAIYNSKLVIANLTNCNPNVMYELALRHGIGKPVIMIAVEGTKLPSDIMMQRTIFYRNDALGVLELRDKLRNTAEKIDFEKKCGMVFEALGEISHDAAMLKNVAEKDSDSKEPLEYIMRRLDRIEALIPTKIEAVPQKSIETPVLPRAIVTYLELPPKWSNEDAPKFLFEEINGDLPGCEIVGIRYETKKMHLLVSINDFGLFSEWKVCELLRHRLLALGFTGVDVSFGYF
jgi:hypothetical protein